MADNLAQQDQGGSTCQYVRTYLGPTLGWAMLPVVPEILVTSTSPLTISPYTSKVLLNAACKSILLPSVSTWMLAQPVLGNLASFDRSIWIKDLAYLASIGAGAIVITPFGTDLIDNLSSFSIVGAGELIRLNPLTDLSGWYVG